jgi:HK97 family phage prohead protease
VKKRIGLTYPLDVCRREVLGVDAALALKEAGDPGTFTGYASVFGKIDLQGEVVDSGAFLRTVDHKDGKFPLLWQHNRDEPIGRVVVEEDEKGLKVTEGQLRIAVTRGADAYELLKAGDIEGMSIGFRTVKDDRDPKTGARHLKEIELWEVSLVTFPANPWAKVRTVKSIDALSAEARALLDGADESDEKLYAAAAALMGARAGAALGEEDDAFCRAWLEKCYERAGRAAPWAEGQTFDDLVHHLKDMIRFAEEAKRADLLQALSAGQMNPGDDPPLFDWLAKTELGPDERPNFAFLDEMLAGGK